MALNDAQRIKADANLKVALDTMPQAIAQVAQLKAMFVRSNAGWAEYATLMTAAGETAALQATGLQYAADTASAWGAAKADLEACIDALAAGMGSDRNTVLDSMKTS